ncbi:MAG: hypothetical protein H6733_00415 [Alphaproteobacteria bacterium]|nr:hypothetical protein [Alphaproteobacteria bacterium]
MDRRAVGRVLAVVALMAVGGWLRLGMLDDGYSPDEFANILYGSVWQILTDPESGVNPPLLRLLNAPFGEAGALVVGRWLSWVGGTAAIGLTFAVARAASGGSTVAGLLAAALVAFNPEAVKMSGRFRSYGVLMPLMAWHALAVGGWMAGQAAGVGDEVRRHARQVQVSAALMPWIHYATIPVMLGLGLVGLAVPRMRRLGLLYVPAAVLVSPMALLVFGNTSARVAQHDSVGTLLVQIVSLQFQAQRIPAPWLHAVGITDSRYGPTAIVVGVGMVLSLLLWRRATDTARFLTLAAWVFVGALVALSGVQLVRSPTASLLLIWTAPLLATLPAYVPDRVVRVLLSAIVGALLLARDAEPLRQLQHYTTYDGLRTFALHFHDLDGERGDLPLYTWPGYTHVGLFFYVRGGHLRRDPWPPPPPCPEEGCWVGDGVAFRACSTWPEAGKNPDPGVYVAFTKAPNPLPPPCVPLPDGDGWTAWRCPGAPPP